MENIFALNNQVFGLNFRERRVSSKTRRAMRSEFVTPINSVEMTYDDVCDVNGGGSSFVGINLTAADTVGFYNFVMSKLCGSGLTGTGLLGFAFLCFQSTPLYASLTAILSSIPVIGWVILGVVVAAGVTLAGCIMYAGAHNKPFSLGVTLQKNAFGFITGFSL